MEKKIKEIIEELAAKANVDAKRYYEFADAGSYISFRKELLPIINTMAADDDEFDFHGFIDTAYNLGNLYFKANEPDTNTLKHST